MPSQHHSFVSFSRFSVLLFAIITLFPSQLLASSFSRRTVKEDGPGPRINALSSVALPSSESPMLLKRGFSSHVDNAKRLTQGQNNAIQITACVLAGISLIASLVALYWFWRMRQKFRHRLIVLLIHADVVRSLWLFVFPLVTFVQGPVRSDSKFCQAGGFLTQTGVEMADISILFIAIHTALQVFKPSMGRIGIEEGGLYKYRYMVYVVTFILPPFLASLAFIRSSTEGYESTGPYCALPIRPFWYRLATSWIPRYAIMLVVAGLYIAIYIHVAVEFRVIGWLGISTVSSTANNGTSQSHTNATDGTFETDLPTPDPGQDTESAFAPEAFRNDTVSDCRSRIGSADATLQSISEPMHRDVRNSVGNSLSTMGDPRPRQTLANDGYVDDLAEHRFHELQPLKKLKEISATGEPIRTEDSSRNAKNKDMQKRHAATQRQLRNLFIYPICYFLIWLIPFVYNVMNYSNHYAQHPVFALVLLSYASLSSMGTVDCVVFTLRERPWRNLPGSDGTFLGSFYQWNYQSRHANSRPRTPAETRHNRLSDFDQLDQDQFSGSEAESTRQSSAQPPETFQGRSEDRRIENRSVVHHKPAMSERQPSQRSQDRYWFDTSTDGHGQDS